MHAVNRHVAFEPQLVQLGVKRQSRDPTPESAVDDPQLHAGKSLSYALVSTVPERKVSTCVPTKIQPLGIGKYPPVAVSSITCDYHTLSFTDDAPPDLDILQSHSPSPALRNICITEQLLYRILNERWFARFPELGQLFWI